VSRASDAALEERLGRSRAPFARLRDRWRARRLDESAWDELEETLLAADVGLATTGALVEDVREAARRAGVQDADDLGPLLEARSRVGSTTAATDRSPPSPGRPACGCSSA